MLVRLLYASRAVEPVDDEAIHSIMEQSNRNNCALGITGVLCMHRGGEVFLQVLEGGRAPVNALYNQLIHDERHQDVTLLSYTEVDERHFSSWRMGCVDLNKINVSTLLKYSESAQLDPYSMNGHGALELLEELVGTAAIVGAE